MNISDSISRRLGLMPNDEFNSVPVKSLVNTLVDYYPTQEENPIELYSKIEGHLGDRYLVDDKLSLADLVLAHYYFDHWVQSQDESTQRFIDQHPRLK